MLKVSVKCSFFTVFIIFFGCSDPEEQHFETESQHVKDSISEVRIDSAFSAITINCDTLMVYQVPKMVDSFFKKPGLLQAFFKNNNKYSDADKKVEKVIRELQADCDSNLLKETYRIIRLRQKLKRVRHKR